jgi:hypothetical protein
MSCCFVVTSLFAASRLELGLRYKSHSRLDFQFMISESGYEGSQDDYWEVRN